MSNPKRSPTARSFWLYGVHAVSAALANLRRPARRLLCTQAALEKIAPLASRRGLSPQISEAKEIARLLPPDAVHQGVALEAGPLAALSLEEWLRGQGETLRPVLLLDQVTDPHNVGAILRSAAAFDAGAVIVPRDHAPPEDSAVLAKSASGALEIVPYISVTNLVQAMETLKKAGYWCIGLDGEAKQTITQAKLNHKTAFVLGAEGKGLRRLTAEHCDLMVRLPIAPQMESLNVSNAAAIALYELYREKA